MADHTEEVRNVARLLSNAANRLEQIAYWRDGQPAIGHAIARITEARGWLREAGHGSHFDGPSLDEMNRQFDEQLDAMERSET